jgi:hypothetical protein
MTNLNSSSAVPNDTPATGTPQPYSDAAAQALKALDTIVSLVPVSPVRQNTPIPYVRRRQAVKRQLIVGAVTTVVATPALQSLLDATATSDTLAFYDAFRPVLDRMNAAVQDLRFELEARYAKAGEDALTVYSTAKRMATRPDNPQLGSHVAAMKPVARSRIRKHSTTPAVPPVAASATPEVPSVQTVPHSVPAEESPAKQS